MCKAHWMRGLLMSALWVPACAATGEEVQVPPSPPELIVHPQSNDARCWAACASAIHRYWGRDESEEAIVQRVKNLTEGSPLTSEFANQLEILTALAPDLPSADRIVLTNLVTTAAGVGVAIAATNREAAVALLARAALQWSKLLVNDWNRVVEGLAAPVTEGRPAPAFVALAPPPGTESTTGHAYVLVGVTYRERALPMQWLRALTDPVMKGLVDGYVIVKAKLIDPGTGTPEYIAGTELIDRAKLVVTHSQATEILEALAHDAHEMLGNTGLSDLPRL